MSISKCWYNTYKGLSDRESIDWRSFGICFAGLCFVLFQLLLAWSDYLFWQLKTNDNFVLSPRASCPYEKLRAQREGEGSEARGPHSRAWSSSHVIFKCRASVISYVLRGLNKELQGWTISRSYGEGGGGATYEKYSYKGKIFKEIREILTEKVHAVKKSPTPALTFLMILSLRVSVPAPWGISPTFQMSYLISLYYPPTTSALIIFSFKYLVILVVPGSPRINLHLYCDGFCEGLF